MDRWDEREKAFDVDTPEEIMDDFEVAKWQVSSYRYKKEHFLIGLDLISEGKRIDERLEFWESTLEILCRKNYQLLKSKGKLWFRRSLKHRSLTPFLMRCHWHRIVIMTRTRVNRYLWSKRKWISLLKFKGKKS